MSFILLSGPAGAGKTYMAAELEMLLTMDPRNTVNRIAFADPIKLAVAAVLGMRGTDEGKIFAINENKHREYSILGGKTIREALQTLGTEWGREMMNKDIWTQTLVQNAQYHAINIVDDLRFLNELSIVRARPDKVFHIHLDRVYKAEEGIDTNHKSEKDCEMLCELADVVYTSEKDYEGLMRKVSTWCDHVRK